MKRRPSLPALVVLVVLALGIVLRLWYYLDARSLFIDEANLALNVAELPWSKFFELLLYDQYAPPLFMVFSKGAVQMLGNQEWALRCLPLTGGIILLFVFCHLNKKLELDPAIYWFPLAMLALSPFMLRFATEFKQYSTDAAVALGIVALALQVPAENIKTRHYWLWAIAGSLVVWLSMPAVFMLCGVGVYYLYPFIKQKKGKALFSLTLVSATWVLSFALLYFTVLKAGTEQSVLLNYHSDYFFPLRLWEATAWKQLGGIFYGLLSPVLGFTVAGLIIGMGLLFWGCYRLFQQKTGVLFLILIPIFACFAASAFQRFSLIPRVSLFLMPLFLLLAACGASEAWKGSSTYGRTALLALLVLEAAPFANSINRLGKPTEIENLKAVLVDVKKLGNAGPAFIDVAAVPAYRYYSQYHDQRQRHLLPAPVLLSWDSNFAEMLNQQRQAASGFWLVFSQLVSDEGRNRMEEKKAIAKTVAREEIKVEKTGAASYWYAY